MIPSATQQGSEPATDVAAIRPFRVIVREAGLAELHRRINATRWPEPETGTDQSQGVQLATIQELARHIVHELLAVLEDGERALAPILGVGQTRQPDGLPSPREREVLALDFAGPSNKAIAEALTVAAPAAPPSGPSGTTDPATAAGLTAREAEVLRLLVQGSTDREIAESLCLSPRTVGGYVTKLLTKLGLDSRTAAAVYAVRRGLA